MIRRFVVQNRVVRACRSTAARFVCGLDDPNHVISRQVLDASPSFRRGRLIEHHHRARGYRTLVNLILSKRDRTRDIREGLLQDILDARDVVVPV